MRVIAFLTSIVLGGTTGLAAPQYVGESTDAGRPMFIHSGLGKRVGLDAVGTIEQIMPSSTTCDKASYPDECRTATKAAPFFIDAFAKYNFTTFQQMAAVLALVGFESDELKYKHNLNNLTYPHLGQGTANMQSGDDNAKYAKHLFPDNTIPTDPAAVLAMVTPDEYNFASAMWFITTQCSPTVFSTLATDFNAGWTAYMGCVGVSPTDPQRAIYMRNATLAFGIHA